MEINLTIENYRCFPSGNPASLTLTKGFAAFVGVNNSGKSSLLKFFYEMRSAFTPIGSNFSVIQQLFGGGKLQLQPPPEILDRDEMFFNGNRDGIRIEVSLASIPARAPDIVTKAIVQIDRNESTCKAKFFIGDSEVS